MIKMSTDIVCFAMLAYMGCIFAATAMCPKHTKNSDIVTDNSTAAYTRTTFYCDKDYRMEVLKVCYAGAWNLAKATCVPVYGKSLAEAMYIEARVQRGKDWESNQTDGNGAGNVLGYTFDNNTDWVTVYWDIQYEENNSPSDHKLGANNTYEFMFVPGTYDSSKAGQMQDPQ